MSTVRLQFVLHFRRSHRPTNTLTMGQMLNYLPSPQTLHGGGDITRCHVTCRERSPRACQMNRLAFNWCSVRQWGHRDIAMQTARSLKIGKIYGWIPATLATTTFNFFLLPPPPQSMEPAANRTQADAFHVIFQAFLENVLVPDCLLLLAPGSPY